PALLSSHCSSFLFQRYGDHPHLPSFPTRRSSDLGCATIEPPALPDDVVPAAWQGPVEEGAAVWPNVEWWNNFDSPELTALIDDRSEEHTSELQSRENLVCRLLLEKKKTTEKTK